MSSMCVLLLSQALERSRRMALGRGGIARTGGVARLEQADDGATT